MQDEADAQLKWVRENMSDAIPDEAFPERLYIFRRDRKINLGDHLDPDPVDWRDYIRKDIADAAVKAERERADKAEADLRVSVGGCDANAGWSHKTISIDGGKYFFCQNCGETLTKTVAKRHSTAAAIRNGEQQ
jgi:hypothetical protein